MHSSVVLSSTRVHLSGSSGMVVRNSVMPSTCEAVASGPRAATMRGANGRCFACSASRS